MKSRCLFMAVLCPFLFCAAFISSTHTSRAEAEPIAVQLYTLRSMASLEEQLAAVQAAGVKSVETVGLQGIETEELKALLEKYELNAVSMHVGMAHLRNEFERLVTASKALGNRLLVMPWIMPDERPTDVAGWHRLGKELGEIAQRVEAEGLMLAYHNHSFEFMKFEGKTGIEHLLDASGPALKVELDVAWAARAGHNPAHVLRQLSGRVVAIHAKDNSPAHRSGEELGLADVGHGVLDWDGILTAAAQVGVQWYIIEHDAPSDPAASVKASAIFLKAQLPAILSTTCSKTQKHPIAVQLYTLRSMDTLEERLAAVRAAGVRFVETVGTHDLAATELKALLQKYDLKAVSTHVSLFTLRRDFDDLVAFNKAMGNQLIVLPALPREEFPTDADGWLAAGRELGQLARWAAAEGMTLAYHNHHFEFAEFDGKTGLELLFEAAGPALKAEIDVAWAAKAGHDPAEVIRSFGDRVVAIHAKDVAKEGQSDNDLGMADVGAGTLDWEAVLSACKQAGVKWYIIEHDLPPDPAASVKASAIFLKANL